MLTKILWRSLWSRRATTALTLLSLTVSFVLLIGIDHLRAQAKASFTQTVSGTDLIVGARSGPVNLLLYSVFRMGNATNNIRWSSYQAIANHPQVAWSIPLSLGDSHRGFRVLGTSQAYFEHYRYGNDRTLTLAQGRPFDDLLETVLGAEVAASLDYQLGDEIVLAHGLGKISFSDHKDHPFTVVGILAPTGTPVDRTVHVSLEGIEAIHVGWQRGVPLPGAVPSAEELAQRDLTPSQITAFMLGLNDRMATFHLQRGINEFRAEPLMAILPGVTLSELWQVLAVGETVLTAVAVLVLVAALIGMLTMLLAALHQRARELALLRAVGAHRWQLLVLVMAEAMLLTALAALLALALISGGLWFGGDWLAAQWGLFISADVLTARSAVIALGGVLLAGLVALVPAALAYRRALASGLGRE